MAGCGGCPGGRRPYPPPICTKRGAGPRLLHQTLQHRYKPTDRDLERHQSITETLSATVGVCVFREIHLYRGQILPGSSDGLLPHSDVHSKPAHRHPVLGVVLDQHGRSSGQSGTGHHYGADDDNTELWVQGFLTKG